MIFLTIALREIFGWHITLLLSATKYLRKFSYVKIVSKGTQGWLKMDECVHEDLNYRLKLNLFRNEYKRPINLEL
jgi:hypothetical protein